LRTFLTQATQVTQEKYASIRASTQQTQRKQVTPGTTAKTLRSLARLETGLNSSTPHSPGVLVAGLIDERSQCLSVSLSALSDGERDSQLGNDSRRACQHCMVLAARSGMRSCDNHWQSLCGAFRHRHSASSRL